MGSEVEINALLSFERLNMHINEEVICSYWVDNKLVDIKGILKGLSCFNSIKIDNLVIRFIGNSSVIKSIKLIKTGEILFINPYVLELCDKKELDTIRERLFGCLIRNDNISLKDKVLKDYDRDKYRLMKESFLYIKPELIEEWIVLVNYLLDNDKGFILNKILEYLKKLSNGGTCIEEVLNKLDIIDEEKDFIRTVIDKYAKNKQVNKVLKLKDGIIFRED